MQDKTCVGDTTALRRFALLSGSIVMLAAAALSVAQAQLPESSSAGGVEYVTGGFGSNASNAFKQAMAEYPLSLTFAASDAGGGARPYVAEVDVVVKDASGAVVMEVPSVGPYFLARLKPGQYTIEATYMGQRQKRDVTVEQGGSSQEVITWTRR